MKLSSRKNLAVLPLLVAGASFGPAVQAQTVNLSGKVEDVTCVGAIAGGNTITLPVASPSDLPTVGSTAHMTGFTINLTGCGTSSQGLVAKARFYVTGANSATNGRLNLGTGSTGAGWQYQLLAGSSGNVLSWVHNHANIDNHAADPGVVLTGATADLPYRIRYYRSGALTKGTGIAQMNFVLYYI